MKPEKDSAQENIKEYKNFVKDCPLGGEPECKDCSHLHYTCSDHKSSCKRFLEFLEDEKVLTCIKMADYGACHETPTWYIDKITDLKKQILIFKGKNRFLTILITKGFLFFLVSKKYVSPTNAFRSFERL